MKRGKVMHEKKIEFRLYCGVCDLETLFFSAEIRPDDVSSLAEAEAKVDREVGSGKPAICQGCKLPATSVRTYLDGFLLEESGLIDFNERYGPLGELPRNHE